MGTCSTATKAGGAGRSAAPTRAEVNSIITKANAAVSANRAGSVFQRLSAQIKRTITSGVNLTRSMAAQIRRGERSPKETTTFSLGGSRQKTSVTKQYRNGSINYTVKQGRKTVLQTTNKASVYKNLAKWYDTELKKQR